MSYLNVFRVTFHKSFIEQLIIFCYFLFPLLICRCLKLLDAVRWFRVCVELPAPTPHPAVPPPPGPKGPAGAPQSHQPKQWAEGGERIFLASPPLTFHSRATWGEAEWVLKAGRSRQRLPAPTHKHTELCTHSHIPNTSSAQVVVQLQDAVHSETHTGIWARIWFTHHTRQKPHISGHLQ